MGGGVGAQLASLASCWHLSSSTHVVNRHAHQRSPASGSLENLSHGPCACVGEGARKPRVHRIDRTVCTDSCTTTTVHDAHQCGATQTHVLPRHRPPTVAFEPLHLHASNHTSTDFAAGSRHAGNNGYTPHYSRASLETVSPRAYDLRASDQPRRSHAAISTCAQSLGSLEDCFSHNVCCRTCPRTFAGLCTSVATPRNPAAWQ